MVHETRLNRRRKPKPKSADAAPETESAPLDSSLLRANRFLPWLIGIITLLIYVRTMTPGMQMGDGTELASAAYVLGVPHPTGYPFYMLLTKLWLVLTGTGEVITRVTLLNCVLMASAAGVSFCIFRDLLLATWRTALSRPLLVVAALMALLTAFVRFHWENAVVTEVYALQFFLSLLFVRVVQRMELAGGPSPRGLLVLTAIFALAIAHHRLSVTLALPLLGVWLWGWRGSRRGADPGRGPVRMRPGLLLGAAAILLAGAAFYLYLPLRAAQQPLVNWGNPVTWNAFYNHIRGTEYLERGLLKPALGKQFSPAILRVFLGMQTLQIVGDLFHQIVPLKENISSIPGLQRIFFTTAPGILFGTLLLGAAAWGVISARRSSMRITTAVITAIALQNVAILYMYNIVDIRDYYLFPFWAVFPALCLVRPWRREGAPTGRQTLLLQMGLAAVVVTALVGNGLKVNRSNDVSAEMLSATILPESTEQMPHGSILLTNSDSDTFTTWYRQRVRGERTDVLNFAANFVYMPWYKAFFTAEQIRDYQITLAPAVADNAEIYAQQVRDAIIDKNVDKHPVFTTVNDPPVLAAWSRVYDVEPVDAVEITNPLVDTSSTVVLYRIKPKAATAP